MELKNKKNQLIDMLSLYLRGKKSLDEVNSFAWEVINHFSTQDKKKLPPVEDFEKEFWYAIWQIQFIADSTHENEGVTKREFERILGFMKKERELPSQFYGSRP